MGTNSPDRHKNYITIIKVKIPVDMGCWDLSEMREGGLGAVDSRVEVDTKILNEGEVNRCRYNPQKNNIVAAKSSTS
jgi:hypothetical protein